MGGNNQGWFWTPERLAKLRLVLDRASERDSEGLYFGAISLSSYVRTNGHHEGLEGLPHSQVQVGLAIFLFLGALEPGRRGKKLPGYKRRYYPDKAKDVSEADILRFRQSRGTKSSVPPGR